MRTVVRVVTVLAIISATNVAGLSGVEAIQHPDTLAARAPVGIAPVETDFPIQYLGVIWDETDDDHHHDGAHSDGFVRFRRAGVWGPWIRLIEDGADKQGIWASGLVAADGADAYQVRGLPVGAIQPRAVALNTTDGPLRTTGHRPAGSALAIDNCLSRAEWGADESLRFDSNGDEVWPPAFYQPQVMTVHHTATQNGDSDPAATVRAIYEYHAVDQGWGDIGYHMLVDEQGRVYEGRWSGTTSTPCSNGGDGSDFAHDANDGLVTAGHTGGYNSGNFGVALLGEFTTHPRFGAEPAQAAVDAAVGVLAEFASRHALDPLTTVDYVNPVNGDTKTVDAISGHRDWKSTECPGERLYDDLPTIRESVATQTTSFSVSIDAPVDGDTVTDTTSISATATEGTTSVEFLLDDTTIAIDSDSSDGWSVSWDTTTASEGDHTLTATATDDAGQTASASITVTVDNIADPTVVFGAPTDGATVAGEISVSATASEGVTSVDFLLDGTLLGSGTESSDGWSISWDTTTASEGDHTLTATATDDAGQTASASITVTVDNVASSIDLTATGRKVRGHPTADLSWSGATGDQVDVLRDGAIVATTDNDGSHTDTVDAHGGGSYTYQICETGTTTCSNEVTLDF